MCVHASQKKAIKKTTRNDSKFSSRELRKPNLDNDLHGPRHETPRKTSWRKTPTREGCGTGHNLYSAFLNKISLRSTTRDLWEAKLSVDNCHSCACDRSHPLNLRNARQRTSPRQWRSNMEKEALHAAFFFYSHTSGRASLTTKNSAWKDNAGNSRDWTSKTNRRNYWGTSGMSR